MKDDSIAGLLGLAVHKPQVIRSRNGGAALALALHCLMVREGFTVVDDSGVVRHSSYQPHPDWARAQDEWVFQYTKDGKANKFVLHCSLQTKSGRMFIHASEALSLTQMNPNNIQVLGLQLENYVPDVSRLSQDNWVGVIEPANEATLQDLFVRYITTPLTEKSEDMPMTFYPAGDATRSSTGTSPYLAYLQSPYALPVIVGVLAVATAAVIVYRRHAR